MNEGTPGLWPFERGQREAHSTQYKTQTISRLYVNVG